MTDLDIDFFNRDDALAHLRHIYAAVNIDGKKHNTGVYFQEIPYDPFTNISTLDYKQAAERGYFKIDFLNVGAYAGVRDNAHLNELMNKEPLWDLLLVNENVDQLFHINGHGDILRLTRPTSVEQLAAVLAMIRPAKRYLIGKKWDTIMKEIWVPPLDDSYYFKKSHAISYALVIVTQMNLKFGNENK